MLGTLREKTEEQLIRQFESFSKNDALTQLRSRAWEHFLKLGLPTPKNEAFQYVPLGALFAGEWDRCEKKEIEEKEIESFILPECKGSHLVFVDGYFSKTLSNTSEINKKIALLYLNEAMKSYGVFLQNRFSKLIKEEKDPFSALNAAMQEDGAFVYFPPGSLEEKPIQILQVITGEEGSPLLSPRLHIFMGKGSEAFFVQTTVHLKKNSYFRNDGVDLALEENAKVRWLQLTDSSENVWHFGSFYATLKRNSSLKSFSFTSGSKTCRQSYKVQLAEEGASVSLQGLSFLQNEREAHTHVLIDHAAPHVYSNQHFKSVLFDQSRSSFEGKILVKKEAQKTEAYQLTNALLLSDKAYAYAKPNLEIFADDVKASHGATVAQLNDEELFYLQTRGLGRKEAKKLLVLGFCNEIYPMNVPARLIQTITGCIERSALNLSK